MIKVHHLNNSRSQRVLWLLEELAVPYEVIRYERNATTMLAPPELKKIHPLGKSPMIEDGGRVHAESGAIVEYLAETYGDGRLVPGDPDGRERYRYWMHFAEGSMGPKITAACDFVTAGGTMAGSQKGGSATHATLTLIIPVTVRLCERPARESVTVTDML